MSRVTIHLFNGVMVSGGGGQSSLPTEYCRRLLAYLSLHPDRRLDRGAVAKAVWSDQADVPRNRLSVSLFLTRQQLDEVSTNGSSCIDCSRGWMQLSTHQIKFDTDDFVEQITQARSAKTDEEKREAYSRAFELYTGPLLPGYSDSWAVLPRTEMANRLLEASAWLAGDAMSHGDPESAKQVLSEAIRKDGDSLATVKSLLEWYRKNTSEEIALEAAENIIDGLNRSGRHQQSMLEDLIENWRQNFAIKQNPNRLYCSLYLKGTGVKQALRSLRGEAAHTNGVLALYDSPEMAIRSGFNLIEKWPNLVIGIETQVTSPSSPPEEHCLKMVESLQPGTVNISDTTRLVMNGANPFPIQPIPDVKGCWRVFPPLAS